MILSTNIAETSITINDIVFVIDYGKVKQVEFCNNITKFNTVWASKVNVEQRKGRAGRVQEGICFNLYSKVLYCIILALILLLYLCFNSLKFEIIIENLKYHDFVKRIKNIGLNIFFPFCDNVMCIVYVYPFFRHDLIC